MRGSNGRGGAMGQARIQGVEGVQTPPARGNRGFNEVFTRPHLDLTRSNFKIFPG